MQPLHKETIWWRNIASLLFQMYEEDSNFHNKSSKNEHCGKGKYNLKCGVLR
jgi:hypothetical protein